MEDRHSVVLDRLRQSTQTARQQDHADQFGYSGDPDPRALTTPAQPEGELDTLGPDGLGDTQLISNGGSYGHIANEE